MHHIQAEVARQMIESRIAKAEHVRTVRGLTRSQHTQSRRALRPIVHPGAALARLLRPE
jgi:hypothetical protein